MFLFSFFQIAGGQLQVGEGGGGGGAENNYENISKIQRCIAEGDLEFVSLNFSKPIQLNLLLELNQLIEFTLNVFISFL